MSNIVQLTSDLKWKSTEAIIAYTQNNLEEITTNWIAIQNVFAWIDEEITATETIKNQERHTKIVKIAWLKHQKDSLAYQMKKSMSNLDKWKENISGVVAEKIEITLDFINWNNPQRFAKLFDKNNPYYYIAVAYILSNATSLKGEKEVILKKLSPFINVLVWANWERSEFVREAQYICSYFVTQTNNENMSDFDRQDKIDELVAWAESLYELFITTEPINQEVIGEKSIIESFDVSRKTTKYVRQFITDWATKNYLDRKINNIVLWVDYSDESKSLWEWKEDDVNEEDNFDDLLDS